MVFTKATTPSARLGDGLSPGAAASPSWAASGVSSGLVSGVKGPCPISKLPEIEARTVDDDVQCSFEVLNEFVCSVPVTGSILASSSSKVLMGRAIDKWE